MSATLAPVSANISNSSHKSEEGFGQHLLIAIGGLFSKIETISRFKETDMRLLACAIAAAAAPILVSGQSFASNGDYRTVVAMEFSSRVTKADIASRIEKAASTCWIGKDPVFAGLKTKPLAAYPDAREKGLQLSLQDPKNKERFANINIFPASRDSDTGYVVQVVQRGDIEVASVLERSIKAIERGRLPCQ